MPKAKHLWLVGIWLGAQSALAIPETSIEQSISDTVIEVAASKPATTTVNDANEKKEALAKAESVAPKASAPVRKSRKIVSRLAPIKVVPAIRSEAEARRMADWRVVYDEAKNLIVPEQKYLIQYEDEENYGRAVHAGANTLTVTFSQDEVNRFKNAIQTITEYRGQMRSHCPTASAQSFMQALDKYAASLGAFNRRALPLMADITENNSLLRLIVDRTTLRDAPVLFSRHLQFKKQRFKDNMEKFVSADKALVESLVAIASLLKVPLSDEDWNRAYGLRDSSVELVSLWPRETIFEATAKLGESREAACVVRTQEQVLDASKGKLAE